VASFLPNAKAGASGQAQPISPPEGEMPGRAEGGIPNTAPHRTSPTTPVHYLIKYLSNAQIGSKFDCGHFVARES
jgi:hypothetical protein